MKYLLLLAALFVVLPTMRAQADAPPGAVYQSPPFNMNPKHFTAVPCGLRLRCSDGLTDSDALAVANQCASERLGFPAGILGLFVRQDGPYHNCALPTTFAPNGTGLGAKAQWPVCCLTPVSEDGVCQMTCHYYMTNDYSG